MKLGSLPPRSSDGLIDQNSDCWTAGSSFEWTSNDLNTNGHVSFRADRWQTAETFYMALTYEFITSNRSKLIPYLVPYNTEMILRQLTIICNQQLWGGVWSHPTTLQRCLTLLGTNCGRLAQHCWSNKQLLFCLYLWKVLKRLNAGIFCFWGSDSGN